MVHVIIAYLTLSLTPSRGVQAFLGTNGGGALLSRASRPSTRKISNIHHHRRQEYNNGMMERKCTFLSAFAKPDSSSLSNENRFASSLTGNPPPPPLVTDDDDGSFGGGGGGGSFVMNRRRSAALLLSGATTGLVSSALFGSVAKAAATSSDDFVILDDTKKSKDNDTLEAARANLISAIYFNANNDDIVLKAIDRLVPFDPSRGRAASVELEPDLAGEWKLLWSFGAENFSPLLKLPPPFRPTSFQYLGPAAAAEVGAGRAAQGLTGGVLFGNDKQLWLSSGTQPSDTDASVLEIFPPFRLQLGGPYLSGKEKVTLIEANSDADFRKINGRTTEAQLAPKNLYKQLYLERTSSSSSFPGAIGDIGRGSLRISTIIEGDPVILGEIFVHQKL